MNAIITAATDYKPEALDIFLRSAAENCRDTTLYVVIRRKDHHAFSERFRDIPYIKWIPLPRARNKGVRFYYRPLAAVLARSGFPPRNRLFECLGRFCLNIAVERYFYAWDIIRRHENLDKVLLCDSRDVVIQKDPFIHCRDALICGREQMTVGKCRFNFKWTAHVYGQEAAREMEQWQVVCSGVILGTREKTEEYLRNMCAEIWRNLPRLMRPWWFDQAAHNRLIFKHAIACVLTGNQDGIIATLGYEDEQHITTDPQKGLVYVRGICPAIVHQYDRFPHLIDFYNAAYRR